MIYFLQRITMYIKLWSTFFLRNKLVALPYVVAWMLYEKDTNIDYVYVEFLLSQSIYFCKGVWCLFIVSTNVRDLVKYSPFEALIYLLFSSHIFVFKTGHCVEDIIMFSALNFISKVDVRYAEIYMCDMHINSSFDLSLIVTMFCAALKLMFCIKSYLTSL